MALIYCSACGKQISDKAAACPHCGAAHTPVNTVVNVPVQPIAQPQVPAQQTPKNSNKVIITVGAILAVLLIALIVVVIMVNGGDKSQGDNNSISTVATTTSNNNYVPPATAATSANNTPDESVATTPTVAVYNVTLSVNCKKNTNVAWLGRDANNLYDVDILIDGKNLATLPHGKTQEYPVLLEAGSHTVEFRIAGLDRNGDPLYNKTDSGSYKKMTFSVSENSSFSYKVVLAKGNDIEVEML